MKKSGWYEYRVNKKGFECCRANSINQIACYMKRMKADSDSRYSVQKRFIDENNRAWAWVECKKEAFLQ